MGTRLDFIHAVLNDPRIGRPTSQENEHAMLAWIRSEFGTSQPTPARYNPFATTQSKPGCTAFNTFGDPNNPLHVWNYPDWATGVEATVDTLVNGYYAPILDALTNGHDAQAVVDAVHDSPWGSKPTADMLASVYNGGDYDANLIVGDAIPVPAPEPGPAPVGRIAMATVQQGSQGEGVKIVQQLVGAVVDGDFGPQTASMVMAFQSAYGLAADGIVGPITWTALVQRAVGAAVDGVYGPETTAKVTEFQSAHSIGVDGIAGPETLGTIAAVS